MFDKEDKEIVLRELKIWIIAYPRQKELLELFTMKILLELDMRTRFTDELHDATKRTEKTFLERYRVKREPKRRRTRK